MKRKSVVHVGYVVDQIDDMIVKNQIKTMNRMAANSMKVGADVVEKNLEELSQEEKEELEKAAQDSNWGSLQ